MSRNPAPVVVGLVAGSHVVNHAYLLLFAPAFPLLGAELDASVAELGLALGLVNAVVTAGQLPFGYVSDSYSHGAVLVGCLALGTAGAGMAALAPNYPWLLGAAAVIGVGVAGHHPAHYPLISAATPDTHRSRAYSVHGFAGALGLALPFAVVPAAVAAGYGWRTAFAAVAGLGAGYTLVAAVAVRRLPRSVTRAGVRARESPEAGRESGPAGETADTVSSVFSRLLGYTRTVAGSPLIVVLTAVWFVNSVAVWGIRTYAATLLDAGYGLPPGTASLLASAMLVVGAVVLLGGGYLADRIGPLPLLYVGYGSLVVLAGVLSQGVLPVAIAVGGVVLLAATIDLSRPARATLTDVASERENVGKNFALITIGISAGGAVAPPAFGYVIESAAVGPAFLGVAVTAAVALGLAVLLAGYVPADDSGR